MREHFLPRFGERPLHNEDWLTTAEVSQVLSENAGGREVPVKYVNNLIDMGAFKTAYKSGGTYLIQYKDCRDYVVRQSVGRRRVSNPSGNAQRQARFRERRKQQDEKGDRHRRELVVV